ncbi:MAG: hypothetical protein GF332_03315 [Candidatus Moranbacteria bacterium]|nr:hypothetical protein [Candidatus Moranbacteria bacterium]
MCRILVFQANKKQKPLKYLKAFAQMCQQSKKWQGDGWGIYYHNQAQSNWVLFNSVKSIWLDQACFHKIPASNFFLVHARGASFQKHKYCLNFNQPFNKQKIIFAFNGFLNNVSLPYKVPGNIGSKKIFNLFLKFKHELKSSKKALEQLIKALLTNTRLIEALNLAIYDQKNLYLYTRFLSDPAYFQLKQFQNRDQTIICSEPILNLTFKPIPQDQIIKLSLKS